MSVGVALLEANRELHNVVIDLLFLLHSVTDSSAGMHYCGVIAVSYTHLTLPTKA